MKTILIAAATALFALAAPSLSVAGDHGSHPPMGPPLSVICAAKPLADQFGCLHPGYTTRLADLHDLSSTFSSCSNAVDVSGHVILHVDPHTGRLTDSCGSGFYPPSVP